MSKWVTALLAAVLGGAVLVGGWALTHSPGSAALPPAGAQEPGTRGPSPEGEADPAGSPREPKEVRRVCPHPADECVPSEVSDPICTEMGRECLKGRVHPCLVRGTCDRVFSCPGPQAQRCARRVLCPQVVGVPCFPPGLERCLRLRLCDALPGVFCAEAAAGACVPGVERCRDAAACLDRSSRGGALPER